ncbi:hypothetical protein HK100_012237 [Physocladia obscura]|uniref:Acid phosphatase n=1 Tax=Physocladia obscura TaxID=109957 RepID=A0AAD5T0M4_9FUNG|nr:hypothetical protein HK100_012237 [Physocladia obscura]
MSTADNGLQLKQVLVVHRHGERVPVRQAPRILAQGDPQHTQLWTQCGIAPFLNAFHEFAFAFDTPLQLPDTTNAHPPFYPPVVKELRVVQGDSILLPPYLFNQNTLKQLTSQPAHADGLCQPGQLTDMGKITLLNFGSNLRQKYAGSHGLIPPILTPHFNAHNLYVRSTGYLRTIESVQYLLAGLFPFHTRYLGPSGDVTIHIKADENMYIDLTCKKLIHLIEPFKKAVDLRFGELTNKMMDRLTQIFPENASPNAYLKDDEVMSTPGSNLTEDEKKSINKPSPQKSVHNKDENDRLKGYNLREIDIFYDTLKCIKASGLELPRGITDQELNDLGTVFMESFVGGLIDAGSDSIAGQATASTVRRLLIGRFVSDLMHHLDKRTQTPLNDEYAVKLGLFSGHDTTILPLLIGLGAATGGNRSWPKFAANITFELFENVGKQKNSSKIGDHFVRVKYNDEPLNLSFCKNYGSHFLGDPSMKNETADI